jgi:hypothetical protein
LAYNYANQVAEVGALEDEHEPGHYDLCSAHASQLTVPAGWRVVRRGPISLLPLAITPGALSALADEVRSIGLCDEPAVPHQMQENSSIVELRRIGHLRVLADVSRAS